MNGLAKPTVPDKYLIDSNVLYWSAFDRARLTGRARAILLDSSNELLVSPFTIVEFGLKVAAGRIAFPKPVEEWVVESSAAIGAVELAFTFQHARAMQLLPWYHKDPFDRMLLAQALAENAAILSADSVFARYSIGVVW